MQKVFANVFPMMALPMADACTSQRGRDAWRRTREQAFGKKLEELLPAEARPAQWKRALAGFKQVGDWMDMNEGPGQFVMGETLCWGDVVIGSWLFAIRRCWGEDNDEWQELMSVEGGRWKKFVEAFSPWHFVDEEAVATLNQWVE